MNKKPGNPELFRGSLGNEWRKPLKSRKEGAPGVLHRLLRLFLLSRLIRAFGCLLASRLGYKGVHVAIRLNPEGRFPGVHERDSEWVQGLVRNGWVSSSSIVGVSSRHPQQAERPPIKRRTRPTLKTSRSHASPASSRRGPASECFVGKKCDFCSFGRGLLLHIAFQCYGDHGD